VCTASPSIVEEFPRFDRRIRRTVASETPATFAMARLALRSPVRPSGRLKALGLAESTHPGEQSDTLYLTPEAFEDFALVVKQFLNELGGAVARGERKNSWGEL
jgi:hypothetical protein